LVDSAKSSRSSRFSWTKSDATGVRCLVAHGEISRLRLSSSRPDVHQDVPAHLLDHVLHDEIAPLVLVEVELLDDAFEPGPAEDLLADHLQPVVDLRGHRRTHVVFGHALRDDENERRGPVPIGQQQGDDEGEARDEQRRDGDEPPVGPRDAKEVLGRVLLAG
jgi:hypothetical protein